MSKRHSRKKNPAKISKIAFWEMSKRHLWKKNPDLKRGLDFFSRNDAYSFPEIRFFQKSHQNNWIVAKWIIFPEMTLPDVPKRVWIFFPEMTLAHFPDFRE